MTARKKLIEVALPLDAINKASARDKSIRLGHSGTPHLWWAGQLVTPAGWESQRPDSKGKRLC